MNTLIPRVYQISARVLLYSQSHIGKQRLFKCHVECLPPVVGGPYLAAVNVYDALFTRLHGFEDILVECVGHNLL